MIRPPEPPDESRRLGALRSLRLLDSAVEERFDRVTRLASQLFGVPTALVSLVDENRQWFKSAQGIDAAETPRDVSFCAHAIAANEPLIVADAHRDTRFADNPLVTGDPHIRFYAGCPVAAPDGSKVGTLCILGDTPRQFSAQEVVTLRALARMVEAELVGLNPETNDTLTGLSNRRGFLEIGRYLIAHCKRMEVPLQMLRLHVGFSTDVSDYLAGLTLTELAPILLACFRGGDLVGRIEEREFGVLLYCPQKVVEVAVDRMNRSVERFNADRANDRRVVLTVSHASYDDARHKCLEDLVADAEWRPQF